MITSGPLERFCMGFMRGEGRQAVLLMKDVKKVAMGYINTQEKGLCNCSNLTIFGN